MEFNGNFNRRQDRDGEMIRLKSALDPKRIFKLKVKELETGKKTGLGRRNGPASYTLIKNPAGGHFFNA